MKKAIKTYTALIVLAMFICNVVIPHHVAAGAKVELMYPIQEMSKLECRFQEFDSLSSNCKMILPILKTKDYERYATKNGGYNDFTRIYTVLWGSSYKYGWDVGSGGHQGTDIATARGTPVYNIADGKVIRTGNDVGWGKFVSVEHTIKGKTIVANYAHLYTISVSKGDTIDIGEKIGTVGSTGNSTGNHLHFQIDLPYKFHPYYYDSKTCPYSYYEITETGVCFDDLSRQTIDPLKFLESNGAVLDDIKIEDLARPVAVSSNTVTSPKDIFSTTVYHGYGSSDDVKEVQRIYNKLGYYDGRTSGDFADVEESIIEYQLASGVISDRDEDGAGWFGPKTRTQTKKDYDAYVASGGQTVLTVSKPQNSEETKDKAEEEKEEVAKTVVKTEKVSRVNLMTREERDAQEMAEFLDIYEIDFENSISQIETNSTEISIIKIQNKKGKAFRGNTPGNINFEYDTSKLNVFPNSFFNFTDGTREIKITGLKEGHTSISIKIGDVLVKTLSVSVGKKGEVKSVDSAQIYTPGSVTQGEKSTGIILMKDQYNNKIVGAEYDDRFEVKIGDDARYCIKKGAVADVKAIYKRDCLDAEYKDSLEFGYNDTIAGVLMFDYKIFESGSTDIVLKKAGSSFSKETVAVALPKDATDTIYADAVAYTIENAISETQRGHFMPSREITEYDAQTWLKRSLDDSGKDSSGLTAGDKTQTLTRKEFLTLVNSYYGDNGIGGMREYRDAEEDVESLVASTLGSEYTWRDQFGDFYFQPDKNITREEVAYMLFKIHDERNLQLVRK